MAQKHTKSRKTKKAIILGLLRRKNGASIDDMIAATGWQAHSVRGFLSGTVKKKLRLKLYSKQSAAGILQYFIRSSS